MAGGGLLVVAFVVMGVVLVWPDKPTPAPERAAVEGAGPGSTPASVATADQVVSRFFAALGKGDAQGAGALTTDPTAATRQLGEVWRDLAPTTAKATPAAPVAPADGAVTAAVPFTLTWTLGPQRTWSYQSTLGLRKSGAQWQVEWTPAVLHPKLTADRRLVLVGQAGQPGVLDRDGNPLLVWQGSTLKAADDGIAPLLRPGMARLAGEQGGKNGWHIVLADAAGTELESLYSGGSGASKPIVSTLSVSVQRAAQAAVDSVGQGAILVALQPSTGEILAVAQNAAAGTSPVALNGGYPAGSTFKIATAAAVLEAGAADLNTPQPCPGRATIGQRTITNDGGFDLGTVALHAAFANSCNTTFARLAGDLPADALSRAATQFGLNADFVLPGFTTETGRVDPAASTTERVEDSIGQGTVKVSPFGMALMAATVAAGRAVTPRLWRGLDTTVATGYQAPPRATIDALRTMMREVVTAGTAKSLGARGTVLGKTGTAQFGDAVHSHGWFVGYRADLAFATLVISGESSKAALSVTRQFLNAT